jgi:hypothetical protein
MLGQATTPAPAPAAPAAPVSVNQTLVKLQQGTYGRAVEKLEWSYYDSFAVNPAVLENRLFVVSTAVKTLDQSNFSGNGSLPQGQDFAIRAIKLQYVQSAVRVAVDINSLYTFLSTSTLQFKIEGKASQYTKTLMEIMGLPIGFHVSGAEFASSYGRFVGIDPLNIKIQLAAQTNFDVTINHWAPPAAALTNDRVRVILSGILNRAV